MKKQAYMIITMMVLLTVAGLSSAKAQTNGNPRLVANIPFDFNIGDQTLPAGEYTVQCTNPDSSQKVLRIRSKNGHASALVQTNSVAGKINENAKLVFYRYGDQNFFAQAWLPADSTGMQAPKSRAEKGRELAREKRTTEIVVATARR